jgi:hypothetical protein
MADKRADFQFPAPLDFIRVRGLLEETRVEAGDTADFTVQASLGVIPGIFGPGPFAVQVTSVAIPVGVTTITLLGGTNTLFNLNNGTTKEAHWLVAAGATPNPYNIEITVQFLGPGGIPIGVPQIFSIPVPEQTA